VAVTVEVVGLAALAADMRTAAARSGPLDRAMSGAGQKAVAPVAANVRGSLPDVSGGLAGSVVSGKTRSGGKVILGAGIAYAGPVDFGGWPTSRAYIPNGRYLFPAAVALAGTAASTYSDAIGSALNRYHWTNTGTDPGGVHD
jgi:hypothetical protein